MKTNILLLTSLISFFSFTVKAQNSEEIKTKIVPELMALFEKKGNDTNVLSVCFFKQTTLDSIFKEDYAGLLSRLLVSPIAVYSDILSGMGERISHFKFKKENFTLIKGEELSALSLSEMLVKVMLFRNKLDGVLPIIVAYMDYGQPRIDIFYIRTEKSTNTVSLIPNVTDWGYEYGK